MTGYNHQDLLNIGKFAGNCAQCAFQASYLVNVEERKIQLKNLTDNMVHFYKLLSTLVDECGPREESQ